MFYRNMKSDHWGGGAKETKIDVRIVALTNLNLEQMIASKLFREDLFYRLNVVELKTPALRDIREDIPELIHHFALQVCEELGILAKSFCQRAVSALVERDWPGNVRELQNVVRRVIMFGQGQIIQLEDLNFIENPPQLNRQAVGIPFSPLVSTEMTYKEAKQDIVDSFTTRYISSLLGKTEGNVTKSAELSGLSRAALQKIMKRLGIQASEYR